MIKRLAVLLAFIMVTSCAPPGKSDEVKEQSRDTVSTAQAAEPTPSASYDTYWKTRPFPAGDGKIKLLPEDCGACHTQRVKDWSESLHSKTVGPGLDGQFEARWLPEFAKSCYMCHAPALEQTEMVRSFNGEFVDNPAFNRELRSHGVTCAVCHMRNGTVHGPRKPAVTVPQSTEIHKMKEFPFIKSSEFCKACHQLENGPSLNGKMFVNTYNEWKESSYGKRNITCQSCHMPDGRHLFRGIHDPEMTRSGLEIKVTGRKLTVKSVNIGHEFPSYVTPIVVVQAHQMDEAGKPMKESGKRDFIGRAVTLDLKTEHFDTRIKPGGTFTFDYDLPKIPGAKSLLFEIIVRPDEYYMHFYNVNIKNGNINMDMDKIKEAHKTTRNSPYLLYKKEVGL